MTCRDDVVVVNRPIRVTIGPGAPRPIVVTNVQARQIRAGQQQRGVTVQQPRSDVTVPQPVAVVVHANKTGAQGPAGRDGSVSTLDYPIGQTIHGLRVVRIEGGMAYHPDVLVLEHAQQCVGIALTSATTGETTVQLGGPLVESSWNWAAGAVWCAQDGQLTQNPASAGWLLCVGRALNPTTLMIDLDTPIARI